MDGDTLLTDDQSFLYSEKDIALICGSLVTIRKGTLQVIHLTVKEFLSSQQEQCDPASTSLLVNPDHGSVQLTLVCLQCIAKFAEPLVDLGSMAPQIDWALDPSALERCQVRAPLLEYASFSWLSHIIDCKLDDFLKITPTFQNVFSSLATFSWLETCMVSQPDSTLRLLVGIDEIRDRLDGSRRDLQPHQEPSYQFLAGWCTAMSRVFEEYGVILSRRPWEIYLIDFREVFSADPRLQKLWQEFGETSLRSRDLFFNGHRASRLPQAKPQSHLQLQKNLQFGSIDQEPIFLVHDERQHIYIWGETEFVGENNDIFIQNDKTGQRLPPVNGFRGKPGQKWRLIDHQLSPTGKHLALFYNNLTSSSEPVLELYGLTVVWRMKEKISFQRRMNSETWAWIVFSHTSKTSLIDTYSRVIVFQDDHHCITPIGILNLLDGSRRPLPDSIIDCVNFTTLFTSCDGRYMFASDSSDGTFTQARRFNLIEPCHTVNLSWKEESRPLVDVSPTGRYLVLGVSSPRFDIEHKEDSLYLYDTHTDKTVELGFPEPLNYVDSKYYFSRKETRLIAFLIGRFTGLTIMIWDHIRDTPRLTSHATGLLDTLSWRDEIYVHMAAASAVVANRNRSIQRIELGDSIKFLDASKLMDDYPRRLSAISKDCSHWASVIYGQKGAKVQNIDLTSPDASACHSDLEWSQSDIPQVLAQGNSLPVGLSPDLCVLIIDAEVFDLSNPTRGKSPNKRLTLTPFTIEGLPPLLALHRHEILLWGLECHISSCNSYVIYVGRGDQWGNTRRYSSAIILYHIDIQNKTSARLDIMLPEGLISPNASFHPSLPLMAISYGSPTATEIEPFKRNPPPLRLAICDLRSLAMTTLEIPDDQSTEEVAE